MPMLWLMKVTWSFYRLPCLFGSTSKTICSTRYLLYLSMVSKQNFNWDNWESNPSHSWKGWLDVEHSFRCCTLIKWCWYQELAEAVESVQSLSNCLLTVKARITYNWRKMVMVLVIWYGVLTRCSIYESGRCWNPQAGYGSRYRKGNSDVGLQGGSHGSLKQVSLKRRKVHAWSGARKTNQDCCALVVTVWWP